MPGGCYEAITQHKHCVFINYKFGYQMMQSSSIHIAPDFRCRQILCQISPPTEAMKSRIMSLRWHSPGRFSLEIIVLDNEDRKVVSLSQTAPFHVTVTSRRKRFFVCSYGDCKGRNVWARSQYNIHMFS